MFPGVMDEGAHECGQHCQFPSPIEPPSGVIAFGHRRNLFGSQVSSVTMNERDAQPGWPTKSEDEIR